MTVRGRIRECAGKLPVAGAGALRLDGELFYRLSGGGRIVRHDLRGDQGRAQVVLERSLAHGLAVDEGHVYMLHCQYRRDCRIVGLVAEGESTM